MLKENEGRISYEDLEGMGVFKPGDLAEGGFKRWLQEHDIGGPANFDKLLSKEYELTQAETSFAELGQEEQRKRSREWAMLLAMAAMPAIDTALHGKSGTIYGNNIYDNLESQGTQDIYKGSTTSWKPSSLDDAVIGGETKLYRVMSEDEYKSIIKNEGKFSNYDYAMEEKWFATSPEDAAKWGSKFYPDGNYKMIELTVPTNSLGQMYHIEKLDGIGPAYCGGIDFINSIMKGVKLR